VRGHLRGIRPHRVLVSAGRVIALWAILFAKGVATVPAEPAGEPIPDAIVLQADRVDVDENNQTVAEGNVSIELPQGILRTERLTYDGKSGIIAIPGPFLIDTKRGALEGTNLWYSLADEKGSFNDVKGTYRVEEGVSFYFSGRTGRLESEDIVTEGVRFSNYSPIEKAGAQIRVERLGIVGSGNRKVARLEGVQVYFLGVRLVALPRYERNLTTSGHNPLFILPIARFHRDAGALAGLRWYLPYKSLLFGVGGAYSTRLGGLPSVVLFRGDSLSSEAFYGRDFRVNEFGRGKEVRFEPLTTLGYEESFGRVKLGVAGIYAQVTEGETESRWRGVRATGTMDIARFRNVRLIADGHVSRDEFESSSRTRSHGSAGFAGETRRRSYFVGYLNTSHRGDSPFAFQAVRERESAIVSYRRRISPSFEVYAYGDYDLERREIFSHTYALKYFWRGVMFGISVNPEFKDYNFLLGLDGL
jgi:hypothetical protein